MKILVGMSGGIDSSFAVMKLLREGHTVEGVYLIMHEYADPEPAKDAAKKLGIPLSVVDCRETFDKVVRTNFVSEYKMGRTPNPCIICNPDVKFSALASEAAVRGFDRIATGHYARVVRISDGKNTYSAIAAAQDAAKDQSYMLYRLPSEILDVLVLPLGDELKCNMRDYIKGSEFSSLDRKDSQEICFLPSGDYADYIDKVSGKCPSGYFIDARGEKIGEHKGITRYTIGQRKGLGISLGERAFVTEIDPVENTVRLESAPRMTSYVKLDGLHLCSPNGAADGVYQVKVRYAARPASCTVRFDEDTAHVFFDEPQRSVTPGQSAVLYRAGIVVGGGFICK